MINLAQVSNLLVEAGGLDDGIEAVVKAGDANWGVRISEVNVEVGTDAARDRLVLAVTIGAPEPTRRLAVLEAALTYNLLLRETGGVRIALDAPDGDLMLMVDIAHAGLTATGLAVVLRNVAEKALVWRAFVASAGTDVPLAAIADDATMIRI